MEVSVFSYAGIVVGIFILVITIAYPIFAIYLLPVAFSLSPEIVVGATAAREITVRIEDFLIAVLLIRILFEFVLMGQFPPPKLRYNAVIILSMFLYSMSLVLSTSAGVAILAVSPTGGFFFVLKLIQFFLFYFVFFYYIRSQRDINIVLAVSLITLSIMTIYGTLQIPLGERISMPFEGSKAGEAEPNTFGGYLVLLGSIVAGLYSHETKRIKRVVYILLIASAIVPLVYTQSRTSWASAWVALMVFLIITKGLQRKVVIFSLMLLVVMSLPLMPGKIKQRAEFWKSEEGFRSTETVGGTTFDPSTSERIGKYRQIPRYFSRNPVLGVGVTGAGFIDGQYVRVIIETGLLGVFTFSYFLYVILRYMYSVYKSTAIPFSKGFSLGLFCGTIGMLVHGLGATTFFIVRIVEPYMMFLAILVSHGYITSVSKKAEMPIPSQYVYPYLIWHPATESRVDT
ncbi:MAG: O-antigen ligase family protein [Deltaproteobacteria bacterium]|nr:O-antigen ligase family protein [Deltaproteobacteria bacterium]